MKRWRIHIEAWPHSTGAGADADQKAAGARTNYFYVDADDITDAMQMARCFAEGVKRNPAVWMAPIWGVSVYPAGRSEPEDAP